MLMARIAKLLGTRPSEYAGLETGSLEAYLLDAGLVLRMNREDARAREDAKHENPNGLKLRTDFDEPG